MSVQGYLCRANPYSCIGSCYNQPNFNDASKVSCFYSCVTGTTDSGNCPFLTVPDGVVVDTVYIEVPGGGDVAFDWALAEQGFRESFPLFLVVFAAFCIVKVLNLVLK